MDKGLFRQKSIDRISSPEQLHDYMRVTSPKLWMLLSAIVALLAGFVVYAATTTMESTMKLKVQFESGFAQADMLSSQADYIKVRMPVRIGGQTGYVSDIIQASRLRLKVNLDSDEQLADGYYELALEGETDQTVQDQLLLMLTVRGDLITIYNSPETKNLFSKDRRIRIEGRLATVTGYEVIDTSTVVFELDDPKVTMPDGVYDAEIVTESTTPIRFLLN